MKSGWRHFFSWWKAHRGYETEESIEDSLMALMFNISAYMHKLELDKKQKELLDDVAKDLFNSNPTTPEPGLSANGSICSVPGCKSCPVNNRT